MTRLAGSSTRAAPIEATALTASGAVAILLAAGAGRRFDPTGAHNKLLARFGETTVAEQVARNVMAAGLTVLAVVREGDTQLPARLQACGCEVLFSANAHRGMGHSLADGARVLAARPTALVALICLADMPFIQADTYAAVARSALRENKPVAAASAGKRGSPVAFQAHFFAALAALTGDSGAGRILAEHPPLLLECDDPAILRDIDSPDDLPPSGSAAAMAPAGNRNFWEDR